jgi:hypothetical protein
MSNSGILYLQLRELWQQRNNTMSGDPKRQSIEKALVLKSLEYMKVSVDELSKIRLPDRQEFEKVNGDLFREYYNIFEYTDQDEQAEGSYQFARFEELAVPYFPDHLSVAKSRYEDAVSNSKHGSGKKLFTYEAELARFQRKWPNA